MSDIKTNHKIRLLFKHADLIASGWTLQAYANEVQRASYVIPQTDGGHHTVFMVLQSEEPVLYLELPVSDWLDGAPLGERLREVLSDSKLTHEVVELWDEMNAHKTPVDAYPFPTSSRPGNVWKFPTSK